MHTKRRGWRLALLGIALAAGLQGAHAALSQPAGQLAGWVLRNEDHHGKPFAIVDKQQAQLHVFDRHGRLAGSTPVLLGATRGDHIVPGVGERAQLHAVRADERTTPAGRFESEPGVNLSGEHVVWVDYASAFAIHRVRPGRSLKMRLARLATDSADDKRVSEGCVVVPVSFYKEVVQRVLGQSASVVYVMPETKRLRAVFSDL